MKLASVLLVVSAFNSFIVFVLGLMTTLGGELQPNIVINLGMLVLGIVGLIAFFATMLANMKIARANKQAAVKK